MRIPLILLLLLTAFPAPAAMRAWRSADGARTFNAEFLYSDGVHVTLKRGDGRILTFAMAKLHPEDQAWVRENIDPGELAPNAPPPKGAAFDQLEFGDDRTEVEKKLKASSLVTVGLDASLLGRTGLNGVYKTTQTIGGLHCYLFFDWTSGGGLREVSLQTQPVSKGQYITSLRGNWTELVELLSKLHGNPEQAAGFPAADDLQDGLILGSHLWYTEDGHSVILGTGQEGTGYNVVVRITSERIKPAPVGAENSGAGNNAGPKPGDFQP